MKSAIYTNINELIQDVESLGSWKDESNLNEYFKILTKLAVIYNHQRNNEYFPNEVYEAVSIICSQKFPTKEVFDEKNDYPQHVSILSLATSASGIRILGERTPIDEISKQTFGIDVYKRHYSKQDEESLTASCKEYLQKIKTQQPS